MREEMAKIDGPGAMQSVAQKLDALERIAQAVASGLAAAGDAAAGDGGFLPPGEGGFLPAGDAAQIGEGPLQAPRSRETEAFGRELADSLARCAQGGPSCGGGACGGGSGGGLWFV